MHQLEKMIYFEPNEEGRIVVAELTERIIDCIYECGGTHMQIGKMYPYTRERNNSALEMLRTLKSYVDPDGLINPGALGL